MIGLNYAIRPARPGDQNQIANLIYFESYVHRHLDWRMPLDWLGEPEFWVMEQEDALAAVLACPPDPKDIYWIRLFARSSMIPLAEAWNGLWQMARPSLSRHPNVVPPVIERSPHEANSGQVAAAIVLNEWFKDLLVASGFEERQQIVVLEHGAVPFEERAVNQDVSIRPMRYDDLFAVAQLDAMAFSPLWQNSLPSLQRAFSQSGVATIAQRGDELVGYQVSTKNPFGAHLARLAVHPKLQGCGIGYSLVQDLLYKIRRMGIYRLTVNTQSDNQSSLALYHRIGFTRTGENYPVYTHEL